MASKCHQEEPGHPAAWAGEVGGTPPWEPSASAQEKERLEFFSADETGWEWSVLPCQGSDSGLRFISHHGSRRPGWASKGLL